MLVKNNCLDENKLFVVTLKNTCKDLSAIQMLQSPLWEIEQLCKGPESSAMTPGRSLPAGQAGENETFQFKYCTKLQPREGTPQERR